MGKLLSARACEIAVFVSAAVLIGVVGYDLSRADLLGEHEGHGGSPHFLRSYHDEAHSILYTFVSASPGDTVRMDGRFIASPNRGYGEPGFPAFIKEPYDFYLVQGLVQTVEAEITAEGAAFEPSQILAFRDFEAPASSGSSELRAVHIGSDIAPVELIPESLKMEKSACLTIGSWSGRDEVGECTRAYTMLWIAPVDAPQYVPLSAERRNEVLEPTYQRTVSASYGVYTTAFLANSSARVVEAVAAGVLLASTALSMRRGASDEWARAVSASSDVVRRVLGRAHALHGLALLAFGAAALVGVLSWMDGVDVTLAWPFPRWTQLMAELALASYVAWCWLWVRRGRILYRVRPPGAIEEQTLA